MTCKHSFIKLRFAVMYISLCLLPVVTFEFCSHNKVMLPF